VIARAPGKIVLSGAYAVLEGAPAIVAAVDRYVTADGDRPAPMVTAEVQAAIAAGAIERAPWFDASPLRAPLPDGSSRKLGLGSSAAILVASIATVTGERVVDPTALAAAVFPAAFAAHRKAQPRGSGIDVAASCFGGLCRARIQRGGELLVEPQTWPPGIVIEVFACPVSASTDDLVGRVRAFAAADPEGYGRLISAASEGAAEAVEASSIPALLRALSLQFDALGELGSCASAGIVTPEVEALRPAAAVEGAVFGPSGAGGGDIAIFVGARGSSAGFREEAERMGFERLSLRVGGIGVSRVLGAAP
jgi:phosphomevalonate kinase